MTSKNKFAVEPMLANLFNLIYRLFSELKSEIAFNSIPWYQIIQFCNPKQLKFPVRFKFSVILLFKINFPSFFHSKYLPISFQILATGAKNLFLVNKALFDGLPSIVIASLIGISGEMTPGETLLISARQASWLCKFDDKSMAWAIRAIAI